jgi:hypothetical protein
MMTGTKLAAVMTGIEKRGRYNAVQPTNLWMTSAAITLGIAIPALVYALMLLGRFRIAFSWCYRFGFAVGARRRFGAG